MITRNCDSFKKIYELIKNILEKNNFTDQVLMISS